VRSIRSRGFDQNLVEDRVVPSVEDRVVASVEDRVVASVEDRVVASVEDRVVPSVDDRVVARVRPAVRGHCMHPGCHVCTLSGGPQRSEAARDHVVRQHVPCGAHECR
jgi:hypothetical protein